MPRQGLEAAYHRCGCSPATGTWSWAFLARTPPVHSARWVHRPAGRQSRRKPVKSRAIGTVEPLNGRWYHDLTVQAGPRSLRKTTAVVLLIGAVAIGALRYGGVEPAVAAAIASAAIAALVLSWPRGLPRRGDRRRGEPDSAELPLPLLPLGLACATVVVGLQLVPLPPWLLHRLSPAAAALFAETLAPVGRWPSWRPVTL